MKKTPLRRKTPLRSKGRGASKPGGQIRRTRLKPVSDKRRGQKANYLEGRARFLAENPMCQCCGNASATDCHHKTKKDGARLTDWENIMTVCRDCHSRIHRNPEWAYREGFLVRVNRIMI